MNQEKSYTIGVFILGDYTKNFETLMELGQSLRPFNIRLYKEYSENKQFVADSIEAGYNEQFDDGRTTGKLLHICPATENILKDIDNFFGYKNGNPVDGVIFGSDFKYSKDRINLKIAALHVYNENGLAVAVLNLGADAARTIGKTYFDYDRNKKPIMLAENTDDALEQLVNQIEQQNGRN